MSWGQGSTLIGTLSQIFSFFLVTPPPRLLIFSKNTKQKQTKADHLRPKSCYIFKLRLGVLISRTVGLSVLPKITKKNAKLYKTFQNICKDSQGGFYDITKCYKTLQNFTKRPPNGNEQPSEDSSVLALHLILCL